MESYASNTPQSPSVSYMATLLVAMVGLGYFFMSDELYPRYKARSNAATWPITTGVVERSEVITTILKYNFFQRADIVIRYQVDGVTYRINEPYFGQAERWQDSKVACADVSRYPVGKKVQVHHAPGDPLLATVETDFTIYTTSFGVFVLIEALAMIGLYSSVVETWRYRKHHL
ncbi:MAG: DUF3592 domain-containing protein [Chitinophagaceae bacterium]|nr:MAG: DUF3592 domain-containing protein [Chitinophagaceae bacterium]